MDIKKNKFLLISIGAIPGALFRWQVDDIFWVNLIGCFLLGFFNSLPIPKKYKLILGVGLCGSMTTFSGWSFQLNTLISQGMYKFFFFHSILFVLTAAFAISLGYIFAKNLKA